MFDAEFLINKLVDDVVKRLQALVTSTGYRLEDTGFWRRLFLPFSPTPPRGSEVLIRHLPPDVFEDELFFFFQPAGKICDIRIMVRPSGVANRGFAFVRFFNAEDANNAVRLLNRQEIRPNYTVWVYKSLENNRLFINHVPTDKSKVEIVNELKRNGMDGFTDVIAYRSVKNNRKNRGFIFVEFHTHEEAASTRRYFMKKKRLFLWGKQVELDWSKPMTDPNPQIMAVVRFFLF